MKRAHGSVWESNPPTRGLAGLHGFEDRREHQSPSAPLAVAEAKCEAHTGPRRPALTGEGDGMTPEP